MKILFVYTGLPKGGIETFFVRISKALFEKGYSVSFLFFSDNKDDELLSEIKKYANTYNIDDYLILSKVSKKLSPLIKLLIPLRIKKLRSDVLSEVIHIHAPDFNSILFTHKILGSKDYSRINISTGVYHINEYNFIKYKRWYFAKKIIFFLKALPPENILFFNEISKNFYNELYSNKFMDSIITPIGIDINKYDKDISARKNNRIVSVGRLTKWKRYNFHMIDVVSSLHKKGVFVKYDSYGDGDQLESLNQIVNDRNLNHLITFHQGVPYKNLKGVIRESLMFIGAGTALIEASACGIPALIGIENETEAFTYGFLHDLKTYSYQEQQLNLKKYKIENFILKLINLNEKDFRIECKKAQERAKDFSVEVTSKDFQKIIQKSKNNNFKLSQYQLFLIVFNMFLNKIAEPKTNYSTRL